MKAKLIFQLPEEQDEYNDAINGTKYRVILDELRNFLRTKRKYENQESIKIEELQDFIYKELNDE